MVPARSAVELVGLPHAPPSLPSPVADASTPSSSAICAGKGNGTSTAPLHVLPVTAALRKHEPRATLRPLHEVMASRVATTRAEFVTRTTPDLPGTRTLHETVLQPMEADTPLGRRHNDDEEQEGEHNATSSRLRPGSRHQSGGVGAAVLVAAEAGDLSQLEQLFRAQPDAATASETHPRHGGTPLHLVCVGPGDDEDTIACIDLLMAQGGFLVCPVGMSTARSWCLVCRAAFRRGHQRSRQQWIDTVALGGWCGMRSRFEEVA